MQENELIRQVIETIRKDIVTDKNFMSALIGNLKLTEKNIPHELIIKMMNDLGNKQEIRQPVSNQPKDMKGTKVAKPISIGADSIEAQIVSDLLDGNNVYLMGKAGTGKAQPLTSKILTESGWKTFADIKVGDKVFGEDGKLYEVDGVYDRGVKSVYTITFNDGGVAESCDEHLWHVQTRSDRNYKRVGTVMPLSDVMGKIKTSGGHANAYIPVNKPIQFQERNHVVDPYLMGVILGDGNITTTTPKITNPAEDMFESLVLPDGMELSQHSSSDKCLTYALVQSKKNNDKSVLSKKLEECGLLGKKSTEKFIPVEYLYDSIENRISLLQGLNDTDGYFSEHHFEYSTSSERLANDYVELVRSLGGTAKISARVPKYTYNGDVRQGMLAYRVHCVFPVNINPFRIKAKAEKYKAPTKYFPKRFMESIEYKGQEPVRCISVTNPTHLYITDGYAVTHNTYLAKAVADSVMGQPVFLINCSQWTSPIEIRGGQTIKGYEEGQLIKAWAEGGILILDELPKLDPNTAGILNDALSETASQPKYDESGNVIPSTIPYIVNGRGEKIYKGQDAKNPDLKYRFSVIATGNTDMMNVGNKYGGNQRQDYSLVDRFAGSFYVIDVDIMKEKSLTYPYVFDVCNAIRGVLDRKADALQSISLRTMLNFNRTFEQQMLYARKSELADIIYNNNGQRIPPKTIKNSIDSFLVMCEKNLQDAIRNDQAFRDATSDEAFVRADEDFDEQFMKKYHLNPKTGKVLSEKEIEKLK